MRAFFALGFAAWCAANFISPAVADSSRNLPSFGDATYAVEFTPTVKRTEQLFISADSYLTMFAREVVTLFDQEPGPNFAGKYILVQWHSGSSAWAGAVINPVTGYVYPLPESNAERLFTVNSVLIVVNPNDNEIEDELDPTSMGREYYAWVEPGWTRVYTTTAALD